MTAPADDATEEALARLRGGELPRALTARGIAALASNPGCRRRALLDAAAIRKEEVAAWAGYEVPFGQSPFAIARGKAFEAQLINDPGGLFLALLRDALELDLSEVGYADLEASGGQADLARRHELTRRALTAAPEHRGTLFYHPLLKFRVGGRYAYLEPDLVTFRHDDTFHVVEIKSFPVVDGQGDPASVSAAALQSAVYVLALQDLLGPAATVHHETLLITPKDFGNAPLASRVDVRKHVGVLTRQLARLDRIPALLAQLPAGLTFDLARDDKRVPQRNPADLVAALQQVAASYAPECLATCEMCYFCRDEASGQTGVLGKSVREDLGGIEYIGRVLLLARGVGPPPPPDQAEAAAIVRRALTLRDAVLQQLRAGGAP